MVRHTFKPVLVELMYFLFMELCGLTLYVTLHNKCLSLHQKTLENVVIVTLLEIKLKKYIFYKEPVEMCLFELNEKRALVTKWYNLLMKFYLGVYLQFMLLISGQRKKA